MSRLQILRSGSSPCQRTAAPTAPRCSAQLPFASLTQASGTKAETRADRRFFHSRAPSIVSAASAASPAPASLTSVRQKQPSASTHGVAALRPGKKAESSSTAQNTPISPSTLARAK